MKILIIGTSGYLGAEIASKANSASHTVTSTFASRPRSGLARFNLLDKNSWSLISETGADVIIWSAKGYHAENSSELFNEFIGILKDKKLVYISSDITLCDKAFKAGSNTGYYARQKLTEQNAVQNLTDSVVFISGPIYGKNCNGVLDKRTAKLKDEQEKQLEFWSDVYKTFVPVSGLASTIVQNLDKTGLYFAGPPERISYYDFYKLHAESVGIDAERIKPSTISNDELSKLHQCRDISYSDNPNRLWDPNLPAGN